MAASGGAQVPPCWTGVAPVGGVRLCQRDGVGWRVALALLPLPSPRLQNYDDFDAQAVMTYSYDAIVPCPKDLKGCAPYTDEAPPRWRRVNRGIWSATLHPFATEPQSSPVCDRASRARLRSGSPPLSLRLRCRMLNRRQGHSVPFCRESTCPNPHAPHAWGRGAVVREEGRLRLELCVPDPVRRCGRRLGQPLRQVDSGARRRQGRPQRVPLVEQVLGPRRTLHCVQRAQQGTRDTPAGTI